MDHQATVHLDEKDYLDRLADFNPWHRPLTHYERILIVAFLSTFISIVACLLFCLIYTQSPLRRRYSTRKFKPIDQFAAYPPNESKEDRLILPTTPKYESVIKLEKIPQSFWNSKRNSTRTSSYGTTSDSEGVLSNGFVEYPKTKNSFSNPSPISNGYSSPSLTYPRIHLSLTTDSTKTQLLIHLTQLDHLFSHPIFDDQAEYSIRLQLFNKKLLKKFAETRQKRRVTLPLSMWTKQEEKTTQNLHRTSDGKWTCDEHLQFEWNKADASSFCLRFLLFSMDRSGIHDFMFESILPFQSSMFPSHQQMIDFQEASQFIFGECFLGIGYLPTAERLTIQVNKFRHLYKTEKNQPIHVNLMATLFHQGRRFFQKKFPSICLDESNEICEIKDTIIQNIPQIDLPLVCVHFELNIESFDRSILSTSSFLLGRQTRYENEWQKIIEHSRQIHLGWYQFFG